MPNGVTASRRVRDESRLVLLIVLVLKLGGARKIAVLGLQLNFRTYFG